MPDRAIRGHFGLLLLIFVLSGFAGLVYQSIWTRYLGLFLGHAAYAQSLVLALFMGGMAAGAGIVARRGIRWRNLVRSYAVVEAVIGLFGVLFHMVFVTALGLSYEVIMPALGEPWLVSAWKWLLAGGLILPQTILLGMTFPLMSGGLIRRWPDRDGDALGGLYFTNSIGAAVGVLVATFLLLPRFGMPGAMLAAGILNLVIAGLAWWLGRGRETPRQAENLPEAERAGAGRRLLYLVLGATFFSSAASFAYEIVFVRMLSLAVGSSLHAFELMLASFIAGIALGALWIRRRADSTDSPLRLVGVLQVLMGLAALLALALYSSSFAWVGFLMDALARSDGGYTLFNLGTAAIAIIVMIPTAFFAGTTLPLFTVALLRDGQGEASIGRVYAFNTLGAIVGVFAAVHFLVPALGVKLALIVAAMVDIGIGVWVLRRLAVERRALIGVGVAIAMMIGSMWLAVNAVPFDPLRLSSGVYRTGTERLPESEELLFYKDGKTASISVVSTPGGILRISTNGKPDASLQFRHEGRPTADEPTMIMAGALPFAYLESVESAAVIGFGSGMTTHTMLASPSLDIVDTIEIEKRMVEGAEWFGDRVKRAYEDSRSNIIIDDAKSYFSGQQRKYDAIVSEPSNPWVSGIGALFSQEFYRFVPRFLKDGGIFVQWLQMYEINENLVGSVLNAMLPEFEDVHGYLTNYGDLLLVASHRPLTDTPDFDSLVRGAFREDLGYINIDAGSQLDFRQVADKRLLEAFARLYDYPANSDYFPILSLEAPRTRFRGMQAEQIVRMPYMDVPVLEWLGVREPPSLDVKLPTDSHFPADNSANDARALARALAMGDFAALEEVKEDLRNWVTGLAAASTICTQRSDAFAGDWLADRLLVLTGLTVPYLPADGLRGVLIDPEWLECESLPEGIGEALALIDAYASRDVEAMEERGRRWLENIDKSRPDYLSRFDQVAFAAVQFSLIGQERYGEAGDLEDEFGSDVKARGDYGFTRSLVLAWLQGME